MNHTECIRVYIYRLHLSVPLGVPVPQPVGVAHPHVAVQGGEEAVLAEPVEAVVHAGAGFNTAVIDLLLYLISRHIPSPKVVVD